MTRSIRALVGALVLALTIAVPVSATTQANTRDVTLTVISTITMTGVPATLNWGVTAKAGDVLTDAMVPITVSTDAVNGWKLLINPSVLTGSGLAAGATIPVNANSLLVAFAGTPPASGFTTTFATYAPIAGSITAAQCGPVCNTTGPSQTVNTTQRLTIPAGQKAGPYTGTVLWTAATLD